MVRNSKGSWFVATTLLAVLCGGSVFAQDPPPGEATGQKIGNAIKAAIGVAFPPVQTIIDAIWPDRNKSKKPDKAIEEALTKQQTQLKAAVTQRLRTVTEAVAEVQLVDTFATNASKANTYIVRVDTLLSAAPSTDDQWVEVSRSFDNAGIFIRRMLDIKPDEIKNKIKDVTDQAEMLGFHDNLAISMNDAASFLKSKKSAPMRDPIQRISQALDGFRLKGTVRLGRLAADISSVADVFRTSDVAPPPPPPPSKIPGDDIFVTIKERLAASRKQ